jgi:hypothetical protein
VPIPNAESRIVVLCVRRDEIKLAENKDRKYPEDRRKNRDPASVWLMCRFISMAGMRGEKMTLAVKFKKKIAVNNKSGKNWARNEVIFFQDISYLEKRKALLPKD